MSARLRAPAPRYGNKAGAAELIEQLMGPINNLVIPFAGMLGELLGRSEPATVETVNDLEGHVVNAWRAIKHAPERVAAACDYPVHELTLHAVHDRLVRSEAPHRPRKRSLKSGRRSKQSLAEWLRADERRFDVDLAARWIWGQSCWIGGGWCIKISRKRRPDLIGHAGSPGYGKGVARCLTHRKRPALAGQGNRPHLGHGVRPHNLTTWRQRPQLSHKGQGVTTPRQIPMVSGSYTGYPALGNGVHSGTHRENLIEWMRALAERLRWTRIICGDWLRALTEAVTTSHGITGVSLDPPYCHTLRDSRLYAEDSPKISAAVRAWCIANGDNPLLRIIVCGKWSEHDELLKHGWTKHVWRKDGETIWASPHCTRLDAAQASSSVQGELFAGDLA